VSDELEVAELKGALLRGLRVELGSPDPGYEAFERHMLLAIRFHRAARLNAPGETERQGWLAYFREHFPGGDEHAQRLWEHWRGRLVKDEFPGPGVAVSHGQPAAHRQLVDPGGLLFINLESMWDDFEQSVDSLIDLLEKQDERRAATLEKWRGRQWSVQEVTFMRESPPAGVISVSTAPVLSTASVTAFGPIELP